MYVEYRSREQVTVEQSMAKDRELVCRATAFPEGLQDVSVVAKFSKQAGRKKVIYGYAIKGALQDCQILYYMCK
jgi:hypothetical protein